MMKHEHATIEAFVSEHDLFTRSADNVVRLPFLIKGELVAPPRFTTAELVAALGSENYGELAGAQVVRQPIIDRALGRPSGDDLLLVMPRLDEPGALTFRNTRPLTEGLYSLKSQDGLEFAERVVKAFAPGTWLFDTVSELTRLTVDTPDSFLNMALAGMGTLISAAKLGVAVDRELGMGGTGGRAFLDGWVEVDRARSPGLSAVLSGAIHGEPLPVSVPAMVRAMPTRQLHIAAGNSPIIPLMSALRAMALKSAAVVKVPEGALVAGCAIGIAMALAGRDHALTKASSIVYWKGGDDRIEAAIMNPLCFDRVAVWGSPSAVESVARRSGMLKCVAFNPRYGVSLIGKQALREDELAATVRRAATDTMIWNQRACIASLVHYVEGNSADGLRYAEALSAELSKWDEAYTQTLSSETLGKLRAARRGALASGTWFTGGNKTAPTSAVVYAPGDFDLMSHPMSRLVVVRSVPSFDAVVAQLHHGVSVVGVAPEQTRLQLRDLVAAQGVSCVLPLGEADTMYAGMPHDSMRPMSELVSWACS